MKHPSHPKVPQKPMKPGMEPKKKLVTKHYLMNNLNLTQVRSAEQLIAQIKVITAGKDPAKIFIGSYEVSEQVEVDNPNYETEFAQHERRIERYENKMRLYKVKMQQYNLDLATYYVDMKKYYDCKVLDLKKGITK